MADSGPFLPRCSYLGPNNLGTVRKILKKSNLPDSEWHDLGLCLGLYEATLKGIEANRPPVAHCMREVLSSWLQKVDNVKNNPPTWEVLKEAIRDIGFNAVADSLDCQLSDMAVSILNEHEPTPDNRISNIADVAKHLNEEGVLTMEITSRIVSASSQFERQKCLFAAVREAVRNNYHHLSVFADVLVRKFSSNATLGKAIIREYEKTFINGAYLSSPEHAGITSDQDTDSESCVISSSPLKPQGSYEFEIPIYVSMSPKFHSIRSSFGRMISKVRSILQRRSLPLNELKLFLEDCYPDLRPALDDTDSLRSVMRVIEGECTLIDLQPLEAVQEEYGFTEMNECIEHYKTEMKEFCQSVSIELCLKERFGLATTHSSLRCETATYVFDWEPKEHMLKDIKVILSKASGKLVKIKFIDTTNSISVTCTFPYSLMGPLLIKTLQNLEMLIANKLTKLTIGYNIIYQQVKANHEARNINAPLVQLHSVSEYSKNHSPVPLLTGFQNTYMSDLFYDNINGFDILSDLPKSSLQKISYIIGQEKWDNLKSVTERFRTWKVSKADYIPLLAAILSLAGLQQKANKIYPDLNVLLVLEKSLKEADKDSSITDKMKMRSIIIHLCDRLQNNNIELYKKFITKICHEKGLTSSDYMKEGYKLFRRLEQDEKLTPDDMDIIDTSLKSSVNFESAYTDYNKWKKFEQKLEEEIGRENIIPQAANFRNVYLNMLDIPTGNFFSPRPKLDHTHYVTATLALVTDYGFTRDDDFTHYTLRKSEDDILQRKYTIPYDEIFPIKMEKNFQILISGRPGAGKTVLLTKVSKDWANGNCLTDVKLLIHVSLRQLAAKSHSPILEDIISLFSSLMRSSIVHSLCQDIEKVNGEGVCFALDGLDEYPNRTKSNDCIMTIIRKEYLPMASVIITSRPTATRYLRLPSLDKHVEIVGFMPKQIEEYVTDYYKKNPRANSPDAGGKLLSYLKSHPNVMDMCYLPLHLSMVLYIDQHRENDPLPKTETGIYTFFITHSVNQYIQQKNEETQSLKITNFEDFESEFREKNEIKMFRRICLIAFKTKLESKLIFNSSYLKDYISDFNYRSDINQLVENGLGILSHSSQKILDGEETLFSFQHLSVQEFLGAYHLSRQTPEECVKYIKSHGNNKDLREFWRYFMGHAKSSESLLPLYSELLAANTLGRSDTLFLTRCLFETRGTPNSRKCCAAFLESRQGEVNVSNIVLNSPDCSAIGYTISQCPNHLRQLLMNYCQVGPGGIDALHYQTKNTLFPNLQKIQIRSRTNPVGEVGGTKLKNILERMTNLHELRLYGNRLSNKSLAELQHVIIPMTNLRILVLSKNDLGPQSGVTIGAILCNLRHLIQFYASYNPIGNEGLESLLPGLLNCTKLKRLGFRDCELTSESGKLISQALSNLLELEQLELYWNNLEDEGIFDMVDSLKNAPQLKQLSVTKNGITDKGGCQLAEVVIKSSLSLEQIRLYYNEVSRETRKAFYDANKYREQNKLHFIKYAI